MKKYTRLEKGKNVTFMMDGETVKSVSYAGYPQLNREDYEAFVEELKGKYEG